MATVTYSLSGNPLQNVVLDEATGIYTDSNGNPVVENRLFKLKALIKGRNILGIRMDDSDDSDDTATLMAEKISTTTPTHDTRARMAGRKTPVVKPGSAGMDRIARGLQDLASGFGFGKKVDQNNERLLAAYARFKNFNTIYQSDVQKITAAIEAAKSKGDANPMLNPVFLKENKDLVESLDPSTGNLESLTRFIRRHPSLKEALPDHDMAAWSALEGAVPAAVVLSHYPQGLPKAKDSAELSYRKRVLRRASGLPEPKEEVAEQPDTDN